MTEIRAMTEGKLGLMDLSVAQLLWSIEKSGGSDALPLLVTGITLYWPVEWTQMSLNFLTFSRMSGGDQVVARWRYHRPPREPRVGLRWSGAQWLDITGGRGDPAPPAPGR